MSFSIGLIYDILFVGILVIAALNGRRRGFLAGMFGLIGSVVAVLGAVWFSRTCAPALYENYLGAAIGDKVSQAVTEQGGSATALVQKYAAMLPQTWQDKLTAALENAVLTQNDTITQQVVGMLEPLLVPFLQAILFLLAALVIRALFRLILRLLRGVNRVPLLGPLNQAMGFAFGLVTGTLDIWMLSILLWLIALASTGKLAWLNTSVLSGSMIYKALTNFNPFLIHY
jgi:uncharacterized membrane protein required for colicin V production